MVPHLEYNPTQWKGKTSDFAVTQTSYITASFQLVVCIKKEDMVFRFAFWWEEVTVLSMMWPGKRHLMYFRIWNSAQ